MEDVKCICGNHSNMINVPRCHLVFNEDLDFELKTYEDGYFTKLEPNDDFTLVEFQDAYNDWDKSYFINCNECGNMCLKCFEQSYRNGSIFKVHKHLLWTGTCINCTLPPK